MRAVYETVRRLAETTIPVLIVGETGTGKELVARAIHREGARRERPMRFINCGAIPGQLIESVLFGHERGAFTGAAQRTKGIFEEADGGTVLLDEIGELSAAAQVALLRVLETKRLSRVGSHQEIAVDVRIIAATHRNLEAMCEDGSFRWDLLYRLNAMTLRLPPLRERSEEIEPLVDTFIKEANESNTCSVWGIEPEALSLLCRYTWPGNVRELRNVIERAVVLVRDGVISIDELPERICQAAYGRQRRQTSAVLSAGPGAAASAPHVRPARPRRQYAITNVMDEPIPEPELRVQVREFEKALLRHALARAGDNQAQAARQLAMPRRTLVHKLQQYDLRGADDRLSVAEQELIAPFVGQLFKDAVRAFEAELIRRALRLSDGNRTRTAQQLGIAPRTLKAKMSDYGLE